MTATHIHPSLLTYAEQIIVENNPVLYGSLNTFLLISTDIHRNCGDACVIFMTYQKEFRSALGGS